MRIAVVLTASAHLCLAACQTTQTYDGTFAGPISAKPSSPPYMRCLPDFWGNCTAVASNRHKYRWRYVRPGVRPRSAEPAERAMQRRAAEPVKRRAAQPAERVVQARDSTVICHPRRRVVGEERPSRDDAQRAAENAWMGSIRYDFGERYQDVNRAKDVRHVCGPSSVSAMLKKPNFRCVLEATPCRAATGTPREPEQAESQVSSRN